MLREIIDLSSSFFWLLDLIPDDSGKKYTSGNISKLTMKRSKMESMYKRGLPKIEEELLSELTKWKTTYGTDIMINGDMYLNVVQSSMEDRENHGKNKRAKINQNASKKFEVRKWKGR